MTEQIDMIEPDEDLSAWRKHYQIVTDTGKSLREVRINAAVPAGVKFYDEESRIKLGTRWLRGSWNS